MGRSFRPALLTLVLVTAPLTAAVFTQVPPATPDGVRALMAASRGDDAFAVAVQLLAMIEARREVRPADMLEALDLAAQASTLRTRDWGAAVPLAERAVALHESQGSSAAIRAGSWLRLAKLLDRVGRFKDAKDAVDRALPLAEQEWRADAPETADLLVTAAIIEYHVGDPARCIAHGRRGVAVEESRGDTIALSNALRSLGLCFNAITDPESIAAFRKARDVAARLGQQTALARALASMSDSLATWGYPFEGLEAAEQSLRIFRAQPGAPPEWTARVLVRLARVRSEIGDLSGARAALEEALPAFERLAPTDGEYSEAVFVLGRVLHGLGQRTDAREHMARGVRLIRATWGETNPVLAWSLEEFAAAIVDEDRPGAEALAREALAIAERHGQTLQIAPLIMARSVEAADPAAAHGWLQRAYAASRSLTLEDKGVRTALASSFERAGDLSQAWQLWLDAEEVGRARIETLTSGLAERQALLAAAEYRRSLDGLLAMLTRHPDTDRAAGAFDRVIRRRATVLDELVSRRQLAAATAGTVREAWDRLGAARQRLARLIVATAGVRPAILQNARGERDDAERALAVASATFRAHQRRLDVGLKEVRGAVPADAALVAYVRYRDPAFASADRYAAFISRGTAAPALVALGDAVVIDRGVAAVRDQIKREMEAAGVGSRRNERLYADAADALRQRIWDPIETHLGGATHVLIVPDGPLGLLNLGALPGRDGGYLIEGRSMHTVTAERDIVPVTAQSQSSGILAIGNPAYDAGPHIARPTSAARGNTTSSATPPYRGGASRCRPFNEMRFDPLPASRRETADVARIWSASVGRTDSRTLTGIQATETAFKTLAAGHRVLHLATHGFFLDEACAPDSSQSAADASLSFAGLAFAGANRRDAAGQDEDEGILTAEEVAALDLTGTEWAVLSACDTGVGSVQIGEGVLGFRRAFQIAGARTTIMSLWPVSDVVSREWMRRLYGAHFQQRKTTADAVRAATLAGLAARRTRGASTHPFYWAGFVASGDWR